MQAQMKFQKITAVFALITSVLFFVFALGFCTDLYYLSYYIDEASFMYVEGSHLYYEVQEFNKMALIYSIVALILVGIMYMMQNTKRRKYYVTNYVSSVLYIGFIIWLAIYDMKYSMLYKNEFLTKVDFATWAEWDSWMPTSSYTESTFWFDCGNIVGAIGIISAILIILNLIWKTVWMVMEKQAIAQLKGKEA